MASTKHTPVGEVGRALEKAFDASTRKTVLNIKYHCVPINLEIYRSVLEKYLRTQEDLNLGDIGEIRTIEQIIEEIKAYVFDNFERNPIIEINNPASWKALIDSESTEIAKLKGKDTVLPAMLTLNKRLVGVLFSSYNSTYDNLFRDFIGKTIAKYLKIAHYVADEKGKKVPVGLDVGHFAGSQPYLVSPELLKLDLVGKELTNRMINISDTEKLSVLNKIKAEIDSSRKTLIETTKADIIDGYLQKEFSEFLVSIKAVLVIPQDTFENRVMLGARLEGVIDATISSMIKVNFSRNFIDEVEFRVVSAIKGQKTNPSQAKKALPTIKLAPVQKSTQLTSSKKSTGSSSISSIKNAPVVNLTSLQNLINSHLQDVISANMGSGDSSSILNYRTGRFASSVKVERMTQSREGMITAFYSYMQNPYATFSDGGRQSIPKSRDPKLLIAKSIREIAATKVANRMRSVLA